MIETTINVSLEEDLPSDLVLNKKITGVKFNIRLITLTKLGYTD